MEWSGKTETPSLAGVNHDADELLMMSFAERVTLIFKRQISLSVIIF